MKIPAEPRSVISDSAEKDLTKVKVSFRSGVFVPTALYFAKICADKQKRSKKVLIAFADSEVLIHCRLTAFVHKFHVEYQNDQGFSS